VSDELDAFPDAEELLAGTAAPTRRANTLVFLIESTAARLRAQSRDVLARSLTDSGAAERDLAFLEAFALGEDPPVRPTVHDLERHAVQWAPLVPDNPRLRAAAARRLGERHELSPRATSGIQRALGIADSRVRQAYQRLYGAPIDEIFAVRVPPAQRLRWAWTRSAAWLEQLPSFWTAYALTLTETVGASILALPIAVAVLGPVAGAGALVLLGLVNVFTVALMAEAVTRGGAIRYGGFFGRLVGDFLGPVGARLLGISLFVTCILLLPVYYLGFGRTLEDATGVPAVVFAALLFAATLYYLRRPTLSATVATALAVGAVNMALIVVLALVAGSRIEAANFSPDAIPLLAAGSFDPSAVGLVVGSILAAYFGHTSVAICGQRVLQRDPSGRSLVRGCAAAQLTAMLLYCLFVLTVNGAVAPARLARETGTALTPLAEAAGPAVHVLGSVFVTLAMGMGAITFSLALYHLVHERLPAATATRTIALPRRRARLVLRRRGLRADLVYLGVRSGQARFRLDVAQRGDTQVIDRAIAPGSAEELLAAGSGAMFALEVTEADDALAKVRVTSNLRVSYEGAWVPGGLGLDEVLALDDRDAELVSWMVRTGEVSLRDVAEHTGGDEARARRMLASLLERGAVRKTGTDGDARYAAQLAGRRARRASALWDALDESAPAAPDTPPAPERGLGPAARSAIAIIPLAAAFLLAATLLVTDSGSFTGLISGIGLVLVSIIAGALPVLLLPSSRRKGEYEPASGVRLLGSPPLLVAVYALFLGTVLVHGLVIWTAPVERIAALVAAAVVIGTTAAMVRGGALAPRLSVEVRYDEARERAVVSTMAAGAPCPTAVDLAYGDRALRRAVVEPEPGHPGLRRCTELKVWAHAVTATGDSVPITGRLQVEIGEAAGGFERFPGSALVAFNGADCRIEMAAGEEEPAS
jgi:amino acid permease